MHILVTGGCGYVGSCLVPALLDDGYKVTVVDIMWFGNALGAHKNLEVIEADIRDIDRIPMAGVDKIIHLANVANDPCGDLNSKLTWEVNVLASMQLVEKAIGNKVRQFIYASSGSVYGVKEEEHVTEELSLVPITDYNKTKMISERVLMSYSDRIIVQSIRPATVCGVSPRMRLDVAVNLLTNLAYNNGKITVFGGDQVRPNIHMKDMVGVYLHFLKREDLVGVFNAGFENISILDIANRVQKHLDAEVIVSESNDPRSYRQNSDKLLATGFTPKYCVEDAIVDVIKAFKSGELIVTDNCYNVKTMNKIFSQ